MSDARKNKSLLEKALSVVTDVKAGEGVTALLLAAQIFFLLLAYYLIKPVRDALIVAMPSGPEYKSYMGGAIAIALLFAVPAYSAFARRLPRNRLVVGVTLFFATHLVAFYAASSSPAVREWIGLGFYVWVGVFNMMVVAQAWAFAADIYNDEQGKRLFPLVGVGASLGSIVGSAVGVFVDGVGVYTMLLVSAGTLVVVAGIVQLVHRREEGSERDDEEKADEAEEKDESKKLSSGAFALVFKHRYLTAIALFSVVFTLVNTNGEYMISTLVVDYAEGVADSGGLPAGESLEDYISGIFSKFYLMVNIISACMQLFLVSRLIRYAGFRVAFFVLPVIALIDSSLMVIAPLWAILRIGKSVENATDYSLNNTLRNMLWLPTTKDMKYRAKQAVDTFFVRMGDVASALLVAGMVGLAGLGIQVFAAVNVALCIVWLAVAWWLLRERAKMKAKHGEEESTA